MRILLAALVVSITSAASAQDCAKYRSQAIAYAASIKCEDLVLGWCASIRKQYIEASAQQCNRMEFLARQPSIPTLNIRIVE